jgi:hypothetical protein
LHETRSFRRNLQLDVARCVRGACSIGAEDELADDRTGLEEAAGS